MRLGKITNHYISDPQLGGDGSGGLKKKECMANVFVRIEQT